MLALRPKVFDQSNEPNLCYHFQSVDIFTYTCLFFKPSYLLSAFHQRFLLSTEQIMMIDVANIKPNIFEHNFYYIHLSTQAISIFVMDF